jgi:NitT/TauT family transport system substrate-binding protein
MIAALVQRAAAATATVAMLCTLAALPARAADKVSVTQYAVNVATLPWAVALEKGMFKANGLDVDGVLSSNGGGTTIRNILASSLPFGEAAVPAVVAAIQGGSNLKIVYGAVNNFGDLAWIVKKDSPYKTIADLKGHKVAFTEPRSATEMILRVIMQRAKLDAQTLPTGGISAGVVALDQGAVDATPVEEPLLIPDPTKYRVLFRVSDYVPEVVWSVGVVDGAYAKAHPDVVRKLIAVRRDAVAYMIAHPIEAQAIYYKAWSTDDPRIMAIMPSLIKAKYWSSGTINEAGLETMLKGMQLVGALDKPLDTAGVVDSSYLH